MDEDANQDIHTNTESAVNSIIAQLIRDGIIVTASVIAFFAVVGLGLWLALNSSTTSDPPCSCQNPACYCHKADAIYATNTRVKQLWNSTLTATAATAQAK